MKKKSKLTFKQKVFCELYTSNGGNATAAADAAGYKKAYSVCSRMLGNVGVKEYIKELTDEAKSKRIATAQERQEFWSSVLRGEIPSRSDEEGNGTYDMKDRLKASELLGKSQADFVDRKQVDVTGDLKVTEITRTIVD